jgi:Na+/H+ antiporter NhaC
MIDRLRALTAPLLVLAVGAALLSVSPERDALLARGVARAVSEDLGRGLEPGSLFHALHGAAAGVDAVRFDVRVDGRSLSRPDLDRALAAQLSRYSMAHRPDRRLHAAGQGEAALEVQLSLETGVATARMQARLDPGGAALHVPLEATIRIPGRASLLPPLLAIAVALLFRRTLLALFVGIYAGAIAAAAAGGAGLAAPLRGLWDVFAIYLVRELTDSFRFEVIGFVVALIAMVGIMTRSGGLRGLVERALHFAHSVRSSLLLTYGMGIAIFFDDYANCMLVGSTVRPLTDRLRVSREKLAFVVDSTAAPIASVALLSTWVAFQVSVFEPQLADVGILESGYEIFVQALPYRFYCGLALLMVGLVIVTGRDFGPMAAAEARARREGRLVRAGGRPPISDALGAMQPAPGLAPDGRRAVVPLVVTFAATLVQILREGGGAALLAQGAPPSMEQLTAIFLAGGGAAPIFVGALWGLASAAFLAGSTALRVGIALAAPAAVLAASTTEGGLATYGVALVSFGCVAGLASAVVTRLLGACERPHLPFSELRRASVASAGTLGFAVVLLFEAWMIGAVCSDLGTADYLVAMFGGAISPTLLPLILFGVAGVVAFATGSSWSTMSILLPNVVLLAASLGAESALGVTGMVVICISAVLDGAILGDHCSPISDTTVLSSVASACDLIDHVRTQAPYALVAALAALGLGYAPLLLVPFWSVPLAWAAGAAALAAVVIGVGRHTSALRDDRLADDGVVS